MPTQNRQENKTHSADQQTDKMTYQHPSTSPTKAVETSGADGENPSTAGPGPSKVQSSTAENRLGHINPSAPEDSNTTPGTVSKK